MIMDKAYTAVFVLSFITATSGFFMVVVFTYIFVIPYRVSREKLFTQCLVTAFFRLHQSDHQNCTLLVDNWSRDSTNDKSYCVGVKVMYKRLDTTWHYGVVSLGESESNLIEVKNSSFVPPCCPVLPGSCTVFNHQDSSVNKNTYRYHQSHSHRVPAYSQGTSIAAPSGENTCHLKLHMENYQPVSLSQQMRCFYSETPTMTRVLETLPSHTVIVNIILWPTVLFICGFVGMFFSCIKMQYDQGDQPQRTEQRSTAALL